MNITETLKGPGFNETIRSITRGHSVFIESVDFRNQPLIFQEFHPAKSWVCSGQIMSSQSIHTEDNKRTETPPQ